MIDAHNEAKELLLDKTAVGRIDRRRFLSKFCGLAGTALLSSSVLEQTFAAGQNQLDNQAALKASYDYIVIGSGAAGSILAAELSASGAQVLVVESGGPDGAPTIMNPSVWFYNVGGPLDYHLPLAPLPQLNNRKFNMALGHVLGGGTSINAMVWARGMQRDYDGWAQNGAKGWSFKDALPIFKSQEDWEGGANEWRGVGGPVHIRRPGDPHPTAPHASRLFLRGDERCSCSGGRAGPDGMDKGSFPVFHG
jgi:choline dehydrogenase